MKLTTNRAVPSSSPSRPQAPFPCGAVSITAGSECWQISSGQGQMRLAPAAAGVLGMIAAVPQMGSDRGEARRSENSKLKQEDVQAEVLGPATEEAAPGIGMVGGVATTFLLRSQK